MNPVFVDTSVLIAAEDTGAQALYAACLAWLDALWQHRSGRTGNQALVEFYDQVVAAPQPMPRGDARAAMRRYQTWAPWKTDAATLETAWAIEARHALPFGDCLALACAQHSGCPAMLSVDLPHGAVYGGVQVLHPLRCTPQEFAEGSVKGAVNIPLDEVESRLNEFKGKPSVIVFCRTGNRSGQAKAILEYNGIKNVTNGINTKTVNEELAK